MKGERIVAGAVALVLISLAGGEPLVAQGFRGEVRTGANFFELRPLVRDSLPEAEVAGEGTRRRLDDRTVVTCTPQNFCRWWRAGATEQVSVVSQELLLAGWGWVRGLSAHVHLRSRYGTDDLWPLSEQEIEAVSAYLSFDREAYRLRGGRLWRADGLGYYNFDGLSALWRPLRGVSVEGYGGWSLARGLNAPRSGDLIDEAADFPPDDRGFLLGAQVSGRVPGRIAGSLTYQREIRTDRLALYTERVALDARAFLGPVVADVATEYDLAYGEFNEARLRVNAPLPRRFELTAEVRHHAPFFELWTIWGAFSPVGFNELSGSLAWSAQALGLRLEAGGAYRSYEETRAETGLAPVRDDGWRITGAARWTDGRWFAGGAYRGDANYGAARFGSEVRFGYTFDRGAYVGLHGSVTETFGELRLNSQRLSGVGVDGAVGVGPASLTGGAAVYRVEAQERPQEGDWTQLRFHAGVTYRFGAEPGGGAGYGGGAGAGAGAVP